MGEITTALSHNEGRELSNALTVVEDRPRAVVVRSPAVSGGKFESVG